MWWIWESEKDKILHIDLLLWVYDFQNDCKAFTFWNKNKGNPENHYNVQIHFEREF